MIRIAAPKRLTLPVPEFDDAWQPVQVPPFWEEYDTDTFEGGGWYRCTFELSVTAKEKPRPIGLCARGIDATSRSRA